MFLAENGIESVHEPVGQSYERELGIEILKPLARPVPSIGGSNLLNPFEEIPQAAGQE